LIDKSTIFDEEDKPYFSTSFLNQLREIPRTEKTLSPNTIKTKCIRIKQLQDREKRKGEKEILFTLRTVAAAVITSTTIVQLKC
jgi:hypothetical protein